MAARRCAAVRRALLPARHARLRSAEERRDGAARRAGPLPLHRREHESRARRLGHAAVAHHEDDHRRRHGTADPRVSKRNAAQTPPPGDRPIKTLERVLSRAGLGSRSEARRWVGEGRVKVNGRVEGDPNRWIDLERDRVLLDDRPIEKQEHVYLLLHKPKGYLTTYRDPEGRKTIYDLLPDRQQYLFPVGRLDLDTSGLLILTNDTAFAERLTNPDYHVPKTYLVKASTHLSDEQLDSLRRGVELRDGPTRPAIVTRVRESGGRTVFTITITEGRNRQVRRMVEALDAKVLKLVRTAIGPIEIGELAAGATRELTRDEVDVLRR
ncbi:MAG: rRNA pseudouridine synthase [Acidobacteria bacterium]|nr:rRNA pseudouridine synthase [Acidobacteriota bacterium]MBV9476115.1 rRNA pseudouridine synthase [Acidobacteriota bacterium]